MTEPSGDRSNKPRRPVVVPAIALTALTVIGITALLGGLNEAPDEVEPLGQGAVLDQGLYDTKFVESRVRVERAQNDFDEDKRFLEVVFDVTNKGDETLPVGLPPEKLEHAFTSTTFAGSLVKITPAFDRDSGPFAFALSKGDETRQLHPGVPSQVILRYRLKDGQQPPDKVTLDVASFEETEGFNNGELEWGMVAEEAGERSYLPVVKARVTLPVKKGGTS
jgi:hypothetical protein